MKIKEVQAIPITGGWYCDDKAALATGKAQSDHHLVRGEPQTPGFRAVREVGRGVGVVLHLDGGHVVCGDGTSVTYAGSAGREPIFRFEEHAGAFRQTVAPWLVGQDTRDFAQLAEGVESLTWEGRVLHTALRYAISQALLEGAALALACTKAEVLAGPYGIGISQQPIRLGIQSGEVDPYTTVDKAIYHRVDAFPHGLIHDVARDLGQDGEKLADYAAWIMTRLSEHQVEEDYQPAVYFDFYGTIGRAFELDLNRMRDYVLRLKDVVSPLTLQIESPVEMDTQAAQIEVLGRLRESLAARTDRVVLIVDEWCNTLADVVLFAQARAVDMIQVKMPDLGGITQSAEAVLECKRHGVGAYLGGSCNETDLSARNAVHLAIATGADQVLARPGMGVDEGVSIMRNEEARLRAILKRRHAQRLGPHSEDCTRPAPSR